MAQLSHRLRAKDLVGRMSLEEKISQMVNTAPAIERLGVAAYDWWNECLHGVARAGQATVFPQAIGLAAMWNPDLMYRIAVAISDEARAKHHDFARKGFRDGYKGLTFWSPNINIFRDPRWGRGQETYGEDPYLTSRLGIAFIKGLQGDHPHYLKLVATPKHLAVHSGPELTRHGFDATVSDRDLAETYLPAFEACIKEGQAASIMTAYNRLNGIPCSAHAGLLEELLRKKWGFDGYVVSDCGAVDDIYLSHKTAGSPEEAASQSVRAGCDLNCGTTYSSLKSAYEQGLITEAAITLAVERLMEARFRLGMFDPEEQVCFSTIPLSVNGCGAHRELARQAACESIVLLHNHKACLPLKKTLSSMAVIGPNADEIETLLGNYNGEPFDAVTPLRGIREAMSPQAVVRYALGCDILGADKSGFADAIQAASDSDVIVAVMGLSPRIEGEETEVAAELGGGDRARLGLPGVQEELLRELRKLDKPVVLVLMAGSCLSVPVELSDAALMLWYPGECGGTALADIIFGDVSPSGRLPVTFYRSADELPPFESYAMAGRTYRFFEGEVLYAFGHGQSYGSFTYQDLLIPDHVPEAGGMTVSVEVTNIGLVAAAEVVELYIAPRSRTRLDPIFSLRGVQKCLLYPGETRRIVFELTADSFGSVADDGIRENRPGLYTVSIGGSQPGSFSETLSAVIELGGSN